MPCMFRSFRRQRKGAPRCVKREGFLVSPQLRSTPPSSLVGNETTAAVEHVRSFLAFLARLDQAREGRRARHSGRDWMMTDEKGRRVDSWGGGYFTMCQHVPAWQDYLAETCGRLAGQTGVAGLYLDEYGFLSQYRCSNRAHDNLHAMGAHMLSGEYGSLRKVRAAVGERTVLYTEEIPTDVMTQFSDGAYTAAVKASLRKGIACPIHLTRFAFSRPTAGWSGPCSTPQRSHTKAPCFACPTGSGPDIAMHGTGGNWRRSLRSTGTPNCG